MILFIIFVPILFFLVYYGWVWYNKYQQLSTIYEAPFQSFDHEVEFDTYGYYGLVLKRTLFIEHSSDIKLKLVEVGGEKEIPIGTIPFTYPLRKNREFEIETHQFYIENPGKYRFFIYFPDKVKGHSSLLSPLRWHHSYTTDHNNLGIELQQTIPWKAKLVVLLTFPIGFILLVYTGIYLVVSG